MSRPSRSEPVAVIGKCRVPLSLQHLHNRLLDVPVQHSWNAEFSHPSPIRLWNFYPPHGFPFVGPVQQLFPNRSRVSDRPTTPLPPLTFLFCRNWAKISRERFETSLT